jgi:hypothetical protein
MTCAVTQTNGFLRPKMQTVKKADFQPLKADFHARIKRCVAKERQLGCCLEVKLYTSQELRKR